PPAATAPLPSRPPETRAHRPSRGPVGQPGATTSAGSKQAAPRGGNALQHDGNLRERAVFVEPTFEFSPRREPVVDRPALIQVELVPGALLAQPVTLEADVVIHPVQVDQAQVGV